MYTKSKGVVKINGTESDPLPIDSGVKQGGGLEPILICTIYG